MSNVIYIKISRYIRDYLSTKYGGYPVRLSDRTEAYAVLSNGLARDSSGKCPSTTAYSENVVEEARKSNKVNGAIRPRKELTSEEIDNLCAIVIPSEIVTKGMTIKTNDTFTLCPTHAQKLKDKLTQEFWRDLMLYIEDCKLTVYAERGKHLNVQEAICDFAVSYDIDIKHIETLTRNYKREKKKILDYAKKKITHTRNI